VRGRRVMNNYRPKWWRSKVLSGIRRKERICEAASKEVYGSVSENCYCIV
jgi:hypothetical protein